jgi:hypothetical protein
MNNLTIKLSGEIQNTNFHDWKNELIDQIQSTNMELASDIDFSSAEQNVKDFKDAEKTLKKAKENAINQAQDIQDLFNAIDEVTDLARQTRLTLERQIKIRKIEVKEEIVLNAIAEMKLFIEIQSDDFKTSDISRFIDKTLFLSKIKGTRGTSGAKDALIELCNQFKNEITLKSAVIQSNANIIDCVPLEHSSLFQDRPYLLNLLPNDLDIIIDERINKYHINQKLINQSHTYDSKVKESILDNSETINNLELEPLGLKETKKIISDLIMQSDDKQIKEALTTCLRLINNEINIIHD